MKKFRNIAGLALGAGLILAGMLLEGGHLSSICQFTAFLMVMGPVFGFALMAYPLSFLKVGMRILFTGNIGSAAQNAQVRQAFTQLGKVAIIAAFISAFIGMAHVFDHLNSPDQIGPGVAVAFVSLLYGFGFKLFVVMPIEAATTQDRHTQNQGGQHGQRHSTSVSRAA